MLHQFKINVYYKGVKQTLRVFDNLEEKDFLNLVKKVFHLEADISKIFLQDSEGNFLLLPKIIPDGLNVHLYIEPEFEQKIENIKKNDMLLPGFKWDDNFSVLMESPLFQMMDMFWERRGKVLVGLQSLVQLYILLENYFVK